MDTVNAPEDNPRRGAVRTAVLLGAVALLFYFTFFLSKL